MAATPPIADPEPGAPVPRDAIDPELVRLARTRPKIGAITAAAVVAACVYFIARMGPDRRFAGEPAEPRPVALADLAAGRVPEDSFVAVEAAPMMGEAVRVATGPRDSGYRVAPARGTAERVWLVVDGDASGKPALRAQVGRVRRVGDLPFAGVLDAHLQAYPRPTFATPAAVRAGFAAGVVGTVAGDTVAVAEGDAVALEVVEPARSIVIASFVGARGAGEGDPGHGPLESAEAWIAELARHGIPATAAPAAAADAMLGQARLEVALPPAEVAQRLEAAKLLATRVDPLTRQHRTTWGELRRSPAGALAVPGGAVPDAAVDLIGLHVRRGADRSAYAVIGGERPADYWYVLPLSIALGLLGLLFGWALVRAVRDLVPARGAARAAAAE